MVRKITVSLEGQTVAALDRQVREGKYPTAAGLCSPPLIFWLSKTGAGG